jgi:hypothetical protein
LAKATSLAHAVVVLSSSPAHSFVRYQTDAKIFALSIKVCYFDKFCRVPRANAKITFNDGRQGHRRDAKRR